MYESISLTVESVLSFVRAGDTHYVLHGHVALTGDQVEHIISTNKLDIACCVVLAKAKSGDHLHLTYMDVHDMGDTFRTYVSVVMEQRQTIESSVTPTAPRIPLPAEDASNEAGLMQ